MQLTNDTEKLWYIARHDSDELLAEVAEINKEKQAQINGK